MKKIICFLYTLNSIYLHGENADKNAFIEIGMIHGMYTMQIDYNEHKYIIPYPEHCNDCPCLNMN